MKENKKKKESKIENVKKNKRQSDERKKDINVKRRKDKTNVKEKEEAMITLQDMAVFNSLYGL